MADSRYKVIYRADEATRGEDALTWAPGCPLALAAVQVSRDVGSGDAFLQLRLKNVSTLEAPSFSLAAICEHVDGSIEQVDVNPLDADIAPGGEYVARAVKLRSGDVESVCATIERVEIVHDGGKAETWLPSSGTIAIEDPPALELSPTQFAERRILLSEAGVAKGSIEFAAAHAVVDHEGWAQCACGQVNVGCGSCCRCGAPLENAEQYQDASFLAKSAAEREARDGLAAKEKSRKHKRNIVIAAFAVIVAIVAIVGFSTYSAGVKQARSQALHEDFSYYISNDSDGSLGELDASGTNFFNIVGEPDSKAYPVTFTCKVELENGLKNGIWVEGTTFDIEFSEDGTASAERETFGYSGASGNRAFQYFSVLKAEAYGNGWVYPTTAVRILVYDKDSGELVYTFEAEN